MDKLEEVKILKQLLDDGVINEEDFKKQKAKILELKIENNNDVSEDIIEVKKDSKSKSKTLDEYEKELLQQSELEEINDVEKNKVKENSDFYEKERLKVKAKLDAEEELKASKRAKQKEVVDKGINKTKRIFKWVLAVFLWLAGIGSITSYENGIINVIMGLFCILLGCMACPKITDYTQKYETYTMHKTVIIWVIVILWMALLVILPPSDAEETTNSNNSNVNSTIENSK